MAGFLDELKSDVMTSDGEAALHRRVEKMKEEFFDLWVQIELNRIKEDIKKQVAQNKFCEADGKRKIQGSYNAFNGFLFIGWKEHFEGDPYSYSNDLLKDLNEKYRQIKKSWHELLEECKRRGIKDEVIDEWGNMRFSEPLLDVKTSHSSRKIGLFWRKRETTYIAKAECKGWSRRFLECILKKLREEGIQVTYKHSYVVHLDFLYPKEKDRKEVALSERLDSEIVEVCSDGSWSFAVDNHIELCYSLVF